MRVAFDSRPASDPDGVGRYSRCLLDALRETVAAGDEIVETHRPSALARSRGADVFHSPWIDGAMLHSPCPMVVTIHDLAMLKRRSEHLRSGLRLRLRRLAAQRAARVIVPTEAVAEDAVGHLRLAREQVVVIPEAANAAMYPRTPEEVAAVRARFELPERFLVWVGGLRHPDPGKQIVKLASTPRELPLVLVGATRPWARELPGVILTGQVSDDAAGGDLQRRACAGVRIDQRGLRPAGGRGAGVRGAGRRLRGAGAARGARRARDVRGARRHAGADRRRAGGGAPRAGAAAMELAGRRARNLGGVRACGERREVQRTLADLHRRRPVGSGRRAGP